MEDEALYEAKKFLEGKGARGTILFVMVTGSQVYGLAEVDSSDVDYLGVYLAPTSEVVSLEAGNINQTLATLPNDPKPDFSLHEVKHFCSLLLKGNPFIMETIFCPWDDELHVYKSPSWKKLKSLAKNCLTKQAVEEHLSYIRDQFNKHKKKPLPGKRVYHVVRLLYEVKRIIIGQEPMIRVEGEEKELLWRIKKGSCNGSELDKIVEDLINFVEASKPWNLPDILDESLLESWVVEMRKAQFLDDNWIG